MDPAVGEALAIGAVEIDTGPGTLGRSRFTVLGALALSSRTRRR